MNRTIGVYLGDAGLRVGILRFATEGNREAASFAYDEQWLTNSARFSIDPALPLIRGPQYHRKSGTQHDSVFFGAIADTEADGWGRRIIVRNRIKQPKKQGAKNKAPLNSLDFLLAVDDFSRVGALRFRDEAGNFIQGALPGQRKAPPLVDLRHLLAASRAVEQNRESAADLEFLLGRGTSLAGLRPKCSVVDEDGTLSVCKFPSLGDTRAVTKGEVLALRLATLAGIHAAEARVVYSEDKPITLARRFDRVGPKRRMYISARTLLQVNDDDDHAYTEIVEGIRAHGHSVAADLEELWRRLVYNILITNVDDHLNNHGFLHVVHGKWALSPAFDINPFPDKARVLTTWIDEESGPDASIEVALSAARYFGLRNTRTKEILGEVVRAVGRWKRVAVGPDIRMSTQEVDQFADAFEHPERKTARAACFPLARSTSCESPTSTSGARKTDEDQPTKHTEHEQN